MSPMRALLVASAATPAEPSLPPVKGAELDAWTLRDSLTDPDTGLFAPPDVRVLQNPTAATALRELTDLAAGAAAEDVLLVYFSGHGLLDLADGEFYWATVDTVQADLRATAVPAATVRALLDACASQTIVVLLDCCHGGAFGAMAPPDRYAGYGRYVISSAPAGGPAVDLADMMSRLSVFTKHLADGLRGHAQDRDRDGYVDVVDLLDYVAGAMQAGGLPAPVHRFEGTALVPLARRPPAPARSTGRRAPAAGRRRKPTVLARDVVATVPLDGGATVAVLHGTDPRRLRVLPGRASVPVAADVEHLTASGGVIGAWSSRAATLYSERLDPLATHRAAPGHRIVKALTCNACAWIFERTEAARSFPIAPHVEWGLRCTILGRDGVELPVDLGRCAEWPVEGIRFIHGGFHALRAGDAAGRHVHVTLQRSHRWLRVPVQELVTIGHSGLRDRQSVGLGGPDIVSMTCHQDGEVGVLEATSETLRFTQSKEVLHEVPLRRWQALLLPHPTGVLALFVASDESSRWQLWRSCHDGSSGRLHEGGRRYRNGTNFANVVSVSERDTAGSCRAVLVSLLGRADRVVDLQPLDSDDVPPDDAPLLVGEGPDAFLARVPSTAGGSTVVRLPKRP